ncbi:putative high-affinity nicotinic acid transporter protein [Neofusicoccum parvum]|uniref:High-affinity nicotinic acid transporter protein n=2 Tax=Neofusicoccum parvum TaxID=310453 RepID=A0ACB5RVU0_9PEZI|nr:putative high-affinity nicotinic acid transporter protein [Neofusicoccum parvum UCRNP2]GME24667.1 putative high-affinity nicotinic acid transporter protein [Neofusicoccum parvum]GME51886.1 putative high-affinity nicotinic acid transporter protein [Neofusicoccum parvum]
MAIDPVTSDQSVSSNSIIQEKGSEDRIENVDDSRRDVGFDVKGTKRLLRKMDVRLIPFLALLYLLSFLDRTNIGNARLAGLETDLGMNGLDYNNALAIFFPFYVAAEVPSNMMMKRTRPALWIPIIMVAWGVCTTLMGLVESYVGLMVARAALGLAEGGLFPGVTFYITMWYRRHECGLRMAVFFSAATAAGAFGGLLARGIAEMDGVGGRAGWAWIFILEGLLTFGIAIMAFFVMHDYPETAKFLDEDEKREVSRRLKLDRSSLADEFDMKFFYHALQDWKIWVHMFITIGVYTPLYSISLFMPTIVRGLGYTDNVAQLMTVPPYVVACVFCIGGGFLADRLQTRGVFMIGFNIVALIGFIMLIASESNAVKYAGVFFAASGIYPNVPQGVAWNGNNIGGSTKRGIGIAMHVGFGNLGGTVAAYIYRAKDGPHYRTGHGTLIGFLVMSTILSTCMTLYLRRENARRDQKNPKRPEDYTEDEKTAERERGDNATFFRYTV